LEPRDAVESPCCGDLWCWQCAVERPPAAFCRCGDELALEDFRPAKAVQALLLKRNQAATNRPQAYRELARDDLLSCPEKCGTILPAGQLEEHIKTCGEVEEPCPNGCYERNMKRKHVQDHLRDDCPLSVVPCRFGCDETILRRELDDHMKDNVALHLSQLQATVEAQQAKITELENEKRANNPRASFVTRKEKLAIVVFYLVGLAVFVGNSLTAKLIFLCGALVLLRWGFKYVLGNIIRRRRPISPTETNILFGLVCVAIMLTAWTWGKVLW
jgi:hypothetical protein